MEDCILFFNKAKIVISITGTGFVFNSSKKLGSLIQKILITALKPYLKKVCQGFSKF